MSKRTTPVVVIGILVIVVGLVAGLRISREGKISEAQVEEYAESVLPWEIVVEKIPALAGHEVRKIVSTRGGEGQSITIDSDSYLLWLLLRSVDEGDLTVSGEYRGIEVVVRYFESEAALQEAVARSPLAGYEVRDGEVIIGFLEGTFPAAGRVRGGNLLRAFVAKQRLWITFTFVTGFEGDPFIKRAELEELVELVKERLLEMNINN